MTQHRSSSLSTAAKALPPIVAALMQPFREFFTAPVWRRLLILIAGMVLSPGKRTVSAALRVMGLGATKDFARYHYVLNHARWSSRAVARKLLAMIVENYAPAGPVVIGLDDTIERRWGPRFPHAESTAIPCAPRMGISSRPAGCAGSLSWPWFPCPGPSDAGACRS